MPVTPGFLLVVLAAAAAASFALRGRSAWSAAAGFVGLGAAVAMAAGLDPSSSSTVLGLPLAASPYARLAIIAAGVSIAGVAIIAELVHSRPPVLHAGLLVGIAAVALALFAAVTAPGDEGNLAPASLGGPAASMLVVAAATALLAPLAGWPGTGGSAGTGWLKVAVVGAALAAAGVLWPPLPAGGRAEAGPPDTTGAVVALLLVAAGLAARAGAIPLQGPVSRLIAATRLPLVAVTAIWLPAVMALAAVAWSAAVLGPLSGLVPPDGRNAAAALGVATLVVGGLVAALQRDLNRLLAWSIVGDAGLLILAIVPEGPDVNDAARAWLLVNAVARTALVAWVLALGRDPNPGAGPGPSTRGWILRLPVVESVVLLVGLVVAAAATYGLPGWPAFEARRTIVEAGIPEPFGLVGLAAAWLGLLAFVRLAIEGFRANPASTASGPDAGPARDRIPGAARAVLAAATALLVGVLAFGLASGIVPVDVRAGDAFRALEETPAQPTATAVPTSEPAP